MRFEEILKDIQSSFGSLWNFKERGNSLEIITPFGTTSQKFVSVFLTKRDEFYIISDGGWIFEGLYDNSFDSGIDCYNKIILHYKDSFNVKTDIGLRGVSKIFYKKTENQIAVPSLVFDMANFISSLVSLSEVEFKDKENEIEKRFSKTAKEYLEKILPKNEWHFNEYLDSKKKVKVSAIMRRKNNTLVLLNFITGSHHDYFRSNIGRALVNFELADTTEESQFIDNKIVLLDNNARGYRPEYWSNWLNLLLSKPKSQKIEWSKRKELQKI